jgi:uncharacterized protein (TIGR02271 family)
MASTVIGVFDDRQQAYRARDELIRAGFSDGEISVSEQNSTSASSSSSSRSSGSSAASHDTGFWASVKDALGFDDDRVDYDYAARKGGTIVRVHAEDSEVDSAVAILKNAGAVDFDDRSTKYRSDNDYGSFASTYTDRTRTSTNTAGTAGYAATAGTTAGDASLSSARADSLRSGSSDEEVIPVVKEDLRVGKRQVSRGGIRVYSHVTERPVEENVTLREERVNVTRRPADRAATDADAFRDRTIEATETAEEAIVDKTARVTEEVVISKDATERTETVRDTVRETDVNVERTDATLPGQAGSSTSKTSGTDTTRSNEKTRR